MSNVIVETEGPVAAAQPSKAQNQPNKFSKSAKRRKTAKAPKKAVKKTIAKRGKAQPLAERSSKKATVIAMMRRPKGVTLPEIISATGWQKHSVRGFVSILGKQGELKIESSKNAAGERTYKIPK